MVSLKTIAEKCGVSTATVSKALNDQRDISEETKSRVRKTAEALGYFPNAAARALKTNRSYNIGVLFEEEAGSGLTHEYFSGVLNGLKVQSEKQGYDITFINTCFENANIPIAEMYLAPLAMADSVLTDSEKRAGCMLVDLGADTTTVSVFYKGILRHLSVIPLGGGNVTKDLTCLQIEEPDAEKMKLKYAKAYTDINNIDPTLNYPIDKDRVVESKKFIEIVEARVEEIVENAWFQIPVEFSDKLLGGIILTGGGSNMPEIDKVFKTHTHIDKVRIAKFVSQTVNSKDPKITNHDGTMNTVFGLLAKGDMNCAGDEIGTDLFSNSAEKPVAAEQHKAPRNPNETAGKGVVLTAAEKAAADEAARKQKELEEAEARLLAEKKAEEEEKRRKENSLIHKMMRGFKKFVKDTISEEE